MGLTEGSSLPSSVSERVSPCVLREGPGHQFDGHEAIQPKDLERLLKHFPWSDPSVTIARHSRDRCCSRIVHPQTFGLYMLAGVYPVWRGALGLIPPAR